MENLKDGRRFMLGTPKGLIELTACFDNQSQTWLFFGPNQEYLFKLGSEGELIPLIADDAAVAGSSDEEFPKYTIKDLHEWGEKA